MPKQYLIVGGNGGIGQALVKKLGETGDRSIIASRNATQPGSITLDLMSASSVAGLEKVNDRFDGIIFTAGYEPQQSLKEMTPEHQQKMFGIHVTGPINALQVLAPKLNKDACVVFISSVAAYKGSYDPLYATAKGAVISLTRTLAVELGKQQIRVNCIAPSLVSDTPVYERMTEDFRQKHIDNTINKRLLSSSECADAIYFLLSQPHITGQVIHINGGQYFGC